MKKINLSGKVFCRQLKGREKFLRLLGGKDKLQGLRSGLVTLKPQEKIGEHKTSAKEEVIIILKGNATIYYDRNKKLKASQNTFVYIPPETVHDVINSGRLLLRYVYVTAQVA